MSNDSSDSATREQGVEFGRLRDALEDHEYPTSQASLLSAYGDWELDLADGTETLGSVLEEQEAASGDETVEFDSATEVHQTVLTLVSDRAVGRTDYSDRGGSLPDEGQDGDSEGDQSL